MANTQLGFFKLFSDVLTPTFGTSGSACFDISAYVPINTPITGYDSDGSKIERVSTTNRKIAIMPQERLMIPTGLIFSIPDGHSVRVHSRSGLAIKQGLIIVNGEGVIDADYVNPSFLLMINLSTKKIIINNGDRLAQGELIKTWRYDMVEVKEAPKETTRSGGFGSTGVASEVKEVENSGSPSTG